MKIIYLASIATALSFSFNAMAQGAYNPQQKAQPKLRPSMSQESDSIKMALNDAKNSFNTLFKTRKDTTTIAIANIDYEDSNLVALKENLKRLRGVKSVSMQYKSSNVLLKIPFKGKPTDLWDQLAPSSKAPFKIVEAGDNYISVKFRNDKAPH